jgi:pSer/pThr/pTyr-binding forkhead associated (FHA) protein
MRDSRNNLRSPAQLYIIAGPMKGHSFPLRAEVDTFRVGRAPENDIHIEDISISRRHLKILRRGGKFFMEDLESHNGTRLDGNPIQAGVEYELPEGLPVSLGNTVISLNKDYTEDEMVTQFSIDVSAETGDSPTGETWSSSANYPRSLCGPWTLTPFVRKSCRSFCPVSKGSMPRPFC